MGKILKALGTAVGGKRPGQAQEVEASPGARVKLLLCKSCVSVHMCEFVHRYVYACANM